MAYDPKVDFYDEFRFPPEFEEQVRREEPIEMEDEEDADS